MNLAGDTGEVQRAIINIGESASDASSRRTGDASLVWQSLVNLNQSSLQPITSESGAKLLVQSLSSAVHNSAVGGTLTVDELSLSLVILERAVSSTIVD